MKEKIFRGGFAFILLWELIAEVVSHQTGHSLMVLVLKPLLMPILAALLWSEGERRIPLLWKWVTAALFFSWLGDLLLMGHLIGHQLFLFGLVAFLVAHVCYIAGFQIVQDKSAQTVLGSKPWYALPILVYGVVLLLVLYKNGGETFASLQYPVLMYTTVILTMVVFALNRYGRVPEVSYGLVLLGAILFVVSDSMIALSKFTAIFQGAELYTRIFIMATYGIAQWLIVEGVRRQAA